jgi:lipid II:glycine glycyltransferase (peptidoglycan interpeptide bridge formation enzyme)
MVEIRTVVDRDAWNALVLALPGADLRQSWPWGEIRGRQGWRVLRLAAHDGDECVAALATFWRRLPGLGVIAYAPRAPLLRDDERAWPALRPLLDAAAHVTGAAFVRVSPGTPQERFDVGARLRAQGLVALPDFWTLWNSPRNVMRLSLAGAERDVLARMARKRRQHVSTAARKGLQAVRAEDHEALGRFHAMAAAHAERGRYPVRSAAYFEALRRAFAPAGGFALVEGRVEGEVCAALLGVRFGAVAYALSAPSTPRARGSAIGDLVHWEWIRWAHAAGCEVVDFGSSGTRVAPPPTDPAGGIYRFKIEIGCEPRLCLPYHDWVADARRHRVVRALEAAAARRARGWLDRLPAGLRVRLAQRVA